jgi:hypothetical protein
MIINTTVMYAIGLVNDRQYNSSIILVGKACALVLDWSPVRLTQTYLNFFLSKVPFSLFEGP